MMKNPRKSNFFLALIPKEVPNPNTLFDDFAQYTGSPGIVHTFAFERHFVLLAHTELTSIYDSNDLTICIHGSLYGTPDHFNYIAEQYRQSPDGFAKNINGSYAIVILDKIKSSSIVVTDRMNSRKVFFEKTPHGEYYFFTSIYFRKQNRTISVPAFSSYMINGYMIHDGTIFNECSIVERATAYTIDNNRLSKKRYWDISYNPVNRSYASFQHDLSDIIISTVQKRISPDKRIFLSLSAGYDVTSILGALHSLKIKQINCISYKYGTAHPQSDEFISQKMAAHCGYGHEFVETYSGDLLKIYSLNAGIGQLLSVCDDALVWETKSSDFSPYGSSALFVGDQFCECDYGSLKNSKEILSACFLADPNKVTKLNRLAHPARISEMIESTNSLLQKSFDGIPVKNPVDVRDYLYIDIRASRLLLNWRENFQGHFIEVLNPFYDNEYLDFFCSVPMKYRLGKKLFKDTVSRMFPDLFSFPRATTYSFIGYQPSAFLQYRNTIRSLLSKEIPGINDLFPVDKTLQLFDEYVSSNAVALPFSPVLSPMKILKKSFLSSPFGGWLYRYKRFHGEIPNELMLLKRLTIAKMFCSQFNTP